MVGKGCVAIACDLRLGNQALTIACNHEKVRPFSLLFPSSSSPLTSPLDHLDHGCILTGIRSNRAHLLWSTRTRFRHHHRARQAEAEGEPLRNEGGAHH